MFTERSTKWTIIQGFFLLGALLSHYTSVVVLTSMGLYVLVRSLVDGVPRRMFVTMCVSQVFLATVLGCLYFGQVRHYIPFGPGASLDYLRPYYYLAGRETPLRFAWRAFFGTFSYAVGFGLNRLPLLFMLVFLVGLAALLSGRTKSPRLMALLVVSPFAVGFVAAIFQVFPFAGSRHQTYLLPFLAAGLSAALACWPRGWALPFLVLAALISPHWATRAAPDNSPRVMPIGDMTATIEYIGRMVPRGTPIFVDYETLQVLRYYLARNDTFSRTLQTGRATEQSYGGYRVVVPKNYVWAFSLDQVFDHSKSRPEP